MFFAILSPKRTTSFSVRFSLFDCPFLEHVSFNMFVCICLFSCCLESRYSHQQMYLQSQQVCPKLSVPILSFFLFFFFFFNFYFYFHFFFPGCLFLWKSLIFQFQSSLLSEQLLLRFYQYPHAIKKQIYSNTMCAAHDSLIWFI